MSKGKLAALGCLVLVSGIGLTARPLMFPITPQENIRAMGRTDANDSKTRAVYVERIIAKGNASIPPVIEAIGNGGTWSRRSWQLNVALKGLGQPARHQLIAAINRESDSRKRIYLIDSLQEVFGDFSRVHLWLNVITQYPSTVQKLQWPLTLKFEENSPSILLGTKQDRINPQFVKWYHNKMIPKGPLPHWQP